MEKKPFSLGKSKLLFRGALIAPVAIPVACLAAASILLAGCEGGIHKDEQPSGQSTGHGGAIRSGSASPGTPYGGQGTSESPAHVIKLPLAEAESLGIQTTLVEQRELIVPLHMTGRIEPDVHKEVDVHTHIAGRVSDIFVKPGDEVKRDQPLALLDSAEVSEIESELIESRSKLKVAKLHEEREKQIYEELLRHPTALIRARTACNQAKSHLDLAENEYKRIKGLYDEKIAATKDFVQAQARLTQEKAAYEEAHATLQREEHLYNNRSILKRDYALAQAEVERISNHISTLTQRLRFLGADQSTIDVVASGKIVGTIRLLAPISGVISFHDIGTGEVVQPSVTIFTIIDTSTVLLQVDLPEVDLQKVKVGDRVKIKIPSYPDQVFNGTIFNIGVNVNPETRTVPMRARLDNHDGRLKKGMFAEIEMEGVRQTMLVCPHQAVIGHEVRKAVFVELPPVDEKEKRGRKVVAYRCFEERPVRTGRETNEFVEILAGLKEGERVVTTGGATLAARAAQP